MCRKIYSTDKFINTMYILCSEYKLQKEKDISKHKKILLRHIIREYTIKHINKLKVLFKKKTTNFFSGKVFTISMLRESEIVAKKRHDTNSTHIVVD